MNQKMYYRYNCILEESKELQNDTKQVLNSQYEQLAKLTDNGISNTPRLKNAMLEEADILDVMSEKFLKVHLESKAQADEIRTRIKEAELLERDSKRKIKLRPMTNAQIDLKENKAQHFAMGATFFKLFWVFFIGCFAGVIIESIW